MKFIKIFLLFLLPCLSANIATGIAYTDPDVVAQLLAIRGTLGEGHPYKTIIFGKHAVGPATVTISGGASTTFTLSATDNYSVHGHTGDEQASIDANTSITGITANAAGTAAGKFPSSLALSTGGTGVTIDANVIINGDLTISTASTTLTVNGDLTVRGNVSIAASTTLTVKGNIIFDGNGASNISISGTVTAKGIQHPFSDGGTVQQGDITMRNTLKTGSNPGVFVDGALSADGSIIFENNKGSDPEPGVHINNASSITANNEIVFRNNKGADDVTNGSPAVQFEYDSTNTLTMTAKRIEFFNNDGGAGTSAAAGGTGGIGVYFLQAATATMTLQSDNNIEFVNNSGGAGGNGSGTTGGAGNYGILLEGGGVTLTAKKDIFFTNNQGGNGGTTTSGVGAAGQNAIDINLSGGTTTLEAYNIIFTYNQGGNGSNGSGAAGGNAGFGTIIRSGTSLTAHCDITFKNNNSGNAGTGTSTGTEGTGADITGTFIATNDIILDNNQGNFEGANIAATITANNIIVSNNKANTTSAQAGAEVSSTTIQATNKICFYKNTTASTTGSVTACHITSATVLCKSGTIIFQENQSDGQHGVAVNSMTAEAHDIVFLDNEGKGAGNGGVHIAGAFSAIITAYNNISFINNKNNDSTAATSGVQSISGSTIRAKEMLIIADTTNQNLSFAGSEFDFYDVSDATALNVTNGNVFHRLTNSAAITGGPQA